MGGLGTAAARRLARQGGVPPLRRPPRAPLRECDVDLLPSPPADPSARRDIDGLVDLYGGTDDLTGHRVPPHLYIRRGGL